MKTRASFRASFLTARNAIVLLPVSLLILQPLWSGSASTSRNAASASSPNNSAPRGYAPPAARDLSVHPNGQTAETQSASIALSQVADRLLNPVALDYHSQSNKLVLSEQSAPGRPSYFELLARDGTCSRFSNLDNLTGKVRIAAVRDRRGGFVPGEVLSSTDAAGVIARISPDGSSVKNPWVTLPKETAPMRGGLCVDRWGAFKGDLIAATEKGRVWRIASSGEATLLVDLSTQLEGITTLPDDAAKYGEWAGKILVGAKGIGGLYAIDAHGKAAYFNIPIYPQDIEVIPNNEDFFGIDSKNGVLWKASAAQFASLAGNILIAQEQPGTLASVRWTGKQFAVETIALSAQWEQVTFAPNCTTSISPTSAFVSMQGADGELTINAPGGCNWTAVSDQPWLNIASSDNGTGDGAIDYVVRENNDQTARTGTITVNGLIFTVIQDGGLGVACGYSISPGSETRQAAGGSGILNVFADARCGWQATTKNSFVVITSGCCGIGNGTVTYVVAPNAGSGRDATITVGGKAFKIKQKANSPPLVNAGPDQTITLPNAASLLGTIIDDNAPVPATVSWSKVSGPASVILGSASTAPTSAIFSTPGTYVLRLTATDSVFTVSDDVVITVNPDPTPPPPDPATVAPPINMTVATTIGSATQFLYTGANPIQTGVAPGTITPALAAVLKGRVLDKTGAPLSLVKITVLDHPEFGQTLSRADGRFDMAVNGGGLLNVKYEKVGLLPLQRMDDVPWQDYCGVPDVVMMGYDPQVTFIDLLANTPIQVARGTTSTDSSGNRQSTLMFKQGTTALMTLPGGAMQGLDKLHVRATEFTVGTSGANAMPGDLPGTSAYTYAVEYSLDEAVAANAIETTLSQPVVQYNENFLNFPAGTIIPSGAYDRTTGQWLPSASGRVVKILSITSGTANLDVNGNGVPATDPEYAALGINTAERQQLATLYAVNQVLWRVPIIHFSAWDSNWPYGPPPDAGPPNGPPPTPPNPPDDCPTCPGSIIGLGGPTLSEEVKLTGVPYFLRYDSERTPGYKADYTATIRLSGGSVPASLKRIELRVIIAGQLYNSTFPAQPNQTTAFTWDGKDIYGRTLQGQTLAVIDIGYVYDGVYQNTGNFGYNGNGIPITGDRARQEVTLHQIQKVKLGTYDMHALALGGWSLSVHHVYDPVGQVLYQGDGERRSVQTVNRAIEAFAGTGTAGFSGDGGPATQAALSTPFHAAVGPDGSVYIVDSDNKRIRKVAPNGVITTAVNLGPITNAIPLRVIIAPDGGIITTGNANLIKIATGGQVTNLAGTLGQLGFSGDGGPATQALFRNTRPYLAPDGSIYISDTANLRIRKISTDGIVRTIVGSGAQGFSGDGGPATQASLNLPSDLVVTPNGTLFFLDHYNYRIRKVGPDGIITTFAGTGIGADTGDGGPALLANIAFGGFLEFEAGFLGGLALGPDGSLYFTQSPTAFGQAARVRRIGPDGIITSVAGTTVRGDAGDGGPALQAQMTLVSVSIGPDGSLYICGGDQFSTGGNRVRRIGTPLPGYTASDIPIPSADGTQLFKFDGAGRHLQTVNTLTGAVVYTFAYDSSGRLIRVTDGDNNMTNIERDGAGNPTGIRSPFNQLTSVTLNSGGYFTAITNPNGEAYQCTYNASGLMLTEKDPRNNQNTFTYDALGRLTRDDDAATGFQTLARTDQSLSFTVTHNTALNRTSSFQVQYLTNGDLQRITTLPSGLQTTSLERANGMNTLTTPDGVVTNKTLSGDPRWQLRAPITTSRTIATPGALNFAGTFARTVTLTDPSDPLSLATQTDTLNINGRTYTSLFTAATKTFNDTTPVGRLATTVIDTQGRTTQQQFANLNPGNYTYDSLGRLATSTSGSGGEARTFTYGYNAAGFLASTTNPLSQVTSFSYDNAGRVTQQTLPDTRIIGFGYDANGNVTSITPPGRPAHSFAYNAVNLLTSYTPPTVAGAGATQFAYNLDQQLTTITRPDALTLNFAYDSAGRLQTLTVPSGAYTYAYSPTTGNLTSIAAPGSNTLNYSYDGFLPTNTTWAGTVAGNVSRVFDNNFRITSQSVNGGNTVGFSYDNDSLLTGAGSLTLTRHAQNGLITGTTLSNVTDTRGYNNFGESNTYSASFNATGLYSFTYTRDKLGRITQKVETIGGVPNTYDYTYDTAGRLTQVMLNNVTISTYAYDSNNNRASLTTSGGTVTGTYDNQDRLMAYGTVTYVYTANGELQNKTDGKKTTQYNYDVLGNLKSVTLPDGTQIDYVIDGQNRRIGKKVNGTLTQGLLYQNQFAPVAELDGSNNIVGRFVYGSRRNVPDYMIKGGATYRIISDTLGSPRLVVDVATGAIAQRIDYDEFGVVMMDTSPGFQPFGFAGGLYDKDTGLVRFGARDYDAQTGRWTAKDPILFAGGDTNLYGYVLNDPVNFTDRLGLYAGVKRPRDPKRDPKKPCPSGDGNSGGNGKSGGYRGFDNDDNIFRSEAGITAEEERRSILEKLNKDLRQYDEEAPEREARRREERKLFEDAPSQLLLLSK